MEKRARRMEMRQKWRIFGCLVVGRHRACLGADIQVINRLRRGNLLEDA